MPPLLFPLRLTFLLLVILEENLLFSLFVIPEGNLLLFLLFNRRYSRVPIVANGR